MIESGIFFWSVYVGKKMKNDCSFIDDSSCELTISETINLSNSFILKNNEIKQINGTITNNKEKLRFFANEERIIISIMLYIVFMGFAMLTHSSKNFTITKIEQIKGVNGVQKLETEYQDKYRDNV